MILRDYQEQAVNLSLASIGAGEGSGLVVMATGTGKSVVMATIAHRFQGKVLVIVHRDRLVKQLAKTIEEVTGCHVAIEKANQRAHDSLAKYTVASVQTLARQARRELFHPERFGLVVVDEAHRAMSCGHLSILSHFKQAYHLGFTATPDRGDAKALPFDRILFEYTLTQAVKEKNLVFLEAELIPLRLDMTSLRTSMGDYKDTDIDRAITPYLNRIADEIVARPGKHLVFLPLCKTSKLMADILTSKGLKTDHVDASTGADQGIERFERGEVDCLTCAMLLSEGVDVPCVDHITILRPTQSRVLFSQMVGRGTRKFPGKDKLTLLDFLWLTKKNKLCRPASLVAESAKVQEIMEKNYRSGGKMSVVDAHDIAEKIHSSTLAREIEANKHNQRERINPLDGIDMDHYRPTHQWMNDPISEGQADYLKKQGVDVRGWTKGRASYVIEQIKQSDSPTPAQRRWLTQHGLPIPATKKIASDMISRRLGPYLTSR